MDNKKWILKLLMNENMGDDIWIIVNRGAAHHGAAHRGAKFLGSNLNFHIYAASN